MARILTGVIDSAVVPLQRAAPRPDRASFDAMSEAIKSNEWKLPWAGGCRCGRTRFEVTAAPLLSSACHCAGCQRMTASAYSLSLAVPAEAFTVTEGEPVIGALHGPNKHF
jgi:hypothetical protein